MRLGELLDASRVLVPLEARNVRDATSRLADALIASGVIADSAGFKRLLEDEWPEDIVSVGDRAFLPHFRTDTAKRVALALGVASEPLARAGEPVRSARIVVLIVAPVAEASEYLRAMSAVAQALSSDEIHDALLAASDPAAALSIPGLSDIPVPAEVRVADIMTASVTAVGPDTPLSEAAQVMLKRGVRALPVTGDQREVLGLLTDGHLLHSLLPAKVSAMSSGHYRAARRKGGGKNAPGRDAGDTPVRDVMDRSVMCLSEDQSVADAAALMLARDVDRFPVTRDGALVGFLTRGDIVRKLLGS